MSSLSDDPKSIKEALSKVTGLSTGTMDAILQQVKQNQALLEQCRGPHDFSRPYRKAGEHVRDWQCTKCGGVIESMHKLWYERGLKHGIHTVASV